MKTNLLFSIVFFISWITCFSQNTETQIKSSEISLVGIWILRDNSNSENFQNIWEFKDNGVFNELKSGYETYGRDSLVADENGSWKLNGDSLTIIITNEILNGIRINFDKAQVLKFILKKEQQVFFLRILDDDYKNKTMLNLTLTKK